MGGKLEQHRPTLLPSNAARVSSSARAGPLSRKRRVWVMNRLALTANTNVGGTASRHRSTVAGSGIR